ncbi:AraC family transcriptional regulator [Nocardioides sp. S5]|uniref:DNA-3-methyladenine glycosylase 2 family protein n=1 Tax=Nocardioides sp. S5 TaxID=2017486 RepID=UPI001A9099D9|nr:Ada metal-binding domain-containing protein [Nocardioides sp. S5]QSR31925.1 AraC family transcriptional regulator [Nocardioides sp. S5]
MTPSGHLDTDACYRAVQSRDRRFDGVFYTAVRTTGIYCRPSCPARTPAVANVSFHATAASAHAAGYRACKRCLPDATPGSPEWDVAADVAGRAMRLIADGLVDREGVDGLARRVGYTPRHLGRLLSQELGATPLALARARRAQTARTLLETTDLAITDVAFAAGFASVRQFNETVREVYDASPSLLRGSRRTPRDGRASGSLAMRLAVRTPFAGRRLLDFLAYHLVPGVEVAAPGCYARTLDLPHGPGTVRLHLDDLAGAGGTGFVEAEFWLADLRDTAAASERARRLLDADCDPGAVDAHLGADPVLGDLVRATPGLRVPGQVDGDETAVRTVIGQQVSVTGARTVAGRIVAAHGRPVDSPVPGLTHLFPDAATLAGVDPETLPMPRARGRALVGLASALAAGEVVLDRGPDRDGVRRALLALPGIGPWTADYVAMRALGHPDVFLPTDLAVRRVLADLGAGGTEPDPHSWQPWRSYALMHLWNPLMPPTPAPDHHPTAAPRPAKEN